ncbi:unnamed protein product [Closterium sp. NIES-53]
MALRPSSVPQRVVLREPPTSSLPHVQDPVSPTITRLLTTVVTDPDLESTAAFALVTELVDFAARSRLDYVASLVTEFESFCPPSVGGELALSSDILEDRQFELECLAAALPRFASMLLCPEGDLDALDIPTPRSYAEAIAGEYSSQWQTAMDAEMASWKSTGTYGVDFFHTFSPTPKMTTLRVLLHVTAQRGYELHSLDFSTAFLQGSLHEEIWLHRPPGFSGTSLVALGFAATSADPSLFLRTDTTMPPFYVIMYVLQRFAFQFSSPQPNPLSTSHSLPAPPSDKSVEPSGPYLEFVGCLTYLMTCTRPDLAYPLSLLARYVAPGRHQKGSVVLTGHSDASWADNQATKRSSQGYTFSLGSGSDSWRTKHIDLRYFLARELQQRRQLRLSYVASRANTADLFTKALGSGNHQRFCTALGLVPTLPHLLVA